MAPFLFGGVVDKCMSSSDPAWGGAYIAVMDWVYSYHGNRVILEHHYGGGAAYLDYLASFVNISAGGSGLLDLSYPGNCCGDWCAPIPAGTALAPNSTARHVSNLINGFMWIKQLRIMASAATVLGKAADHAKWTLLGKVQEAMCRGSHKRAGHWRVDLTGRSLPHLDLATDLPLV